MIREVVVKVLLYQLDKVRTHPNNSSQTLGPARYESIVHER